MPFVEVWKRYRVGFGISNSFCYSLGLSVLHSSGDEVGDVRGFTDNNKHMKMHTMFTTYDNC